MKRTTLRDLHLRTSAIVKAAEEGEVYVIERRGVPVVELRPVDSLPSTRRLPDREKLFSRFPRIKTDSGRILEEDRS